MSAHGVIENGLKQSSTSCIIHTKAIFSTDIKNLVEIGWTHILEFTHAKLAYDTWTFSWCAYSEQEWGTSQRLTQPISSHVILALCQLGAWRNLHHLQSDTANEQSYCSCPQPKRGEAGLSHHMADGANQKPWCSWPQPIRGHETHTSTCCTPDGVTPHIGANFTLF